MARNKISDLRNHLFAQLERLNDETISEDQMKLEIEKSKAMAGIAKPIVESAKVEFAALKQTGQFIRSEFLEIDETQIKKLDQ